MENDNNLPNEYRAYRKKMFRSWLRLGAFALICVIVFWVGFEKGKKSQTETPPIPLQNAIFINKDKNADNSIDFSLFWNVWNLVKDKFVDAENLDAKKLYYGAIKGMLQATDDPYKKFYKIQLF